MNLFIKQKETDLEIKPGRRIQERDSLEVWDEHVLAAIFKMDSP